MGVTVSTIRERDKKNAKYYVGDYYDKRDYTIVDTEGLTVFLIFGLGVFFFWPSGFGLTYHLSLNILKIFRI